MSREQHVSTEQVIHEELQEQSRQDENASKSTDNASSGFGHVATDNAPHRNIPNAPEGIDGSSNERNRFNSQSSWGRYDVQAVQDPTNVLLSQAGGQVKEEAEIKSHDMFQGFESQQNDSELFYGNFYSGTQQETQPTSAGSVADQIPLQKETEQPPQQKSSDCSEQLQSSLAISANHETQQNGTQGLLMANPDNQYQKERDSTTPLWEKRDLDLVQNEASVRYAHQTPLSPRSDGGQRDRHSSTSNSMSSNSRRDRHDTAGNSSTWSQASASTMTGDVQLQSSTERARFTSSGSQRSDPRSRNTSSASHKRDSTDNVPPPPMFNEFSAALSGTVPPPQPFAASAVFSASTPHSTCIDDGSINQSARVIESHNYIRPNSSDQNAKPQFKLGGSEESLLNLRNLGENHKQLEHPSNELKPPFEHPPQIPYQSRELPSQAVVQSPNDANHPPTQHLPVESSKNPYETQVRPPQPVDFLQLPVKPSSQFPSQPPQFSLHGLQQPLQQTFQRESSLPPNPKQFLSEGHSQNFPPQNLRHGASLQQPQNHSYPEESQAIQKPQSSAQQPILQPLHVNQPQQIPALSQPPNSKDFIGHKFQSQLENVQKHNKNYNFGSTFSAEPPAQSDMPGLPPPPSFNLPPSSASVPFPNNTNQTVMKNIPDNILMPPPSESSYERINLKNNRRSPHIANNTSQQSNLNYNNITFARPIGHGDSRSSSRGSDDTIARLRKEYEERKIMKRTTPDSAGSGEQLGSPLLNSTTNSGSKKLGSMSMKSLRNMSQSTASLIAAQEAYENVVLKTEEQTYENHELVSAKKPPLPPKPGVPPRTAQRDTSRRQNSSRSTYGHRRTGSAGSASSLQSDSKSRSYLDRSLQEGRSRSRDEVSRSREELSRSRDGYYDDRGRHDSSRHDKIRHDSSRHDSSHHDSRQDARYAGYEYDRGRYERYRREEMYRREESMRREADRRYPDEQDRIRAGYSEDFYRDYREKYQRNYPGYM